MPESDERRKIRLKREREDVEEEGSDVLNQLGTGKGSAVNDALVNKIDELFRRAEPMIEQVNALYRQYVIGIDSHPPVERRKQLDQLMTALMNMPKANPTYRFRFSTLNSNYITHCERWDKMMKDLESGKIKRVVNRGTRKP